jgi:hypothetical protein
MGRLTAALRALFTDPEPALGFFEALGLGSAGCTSRRSRDEVPPARTQEEISRVLAWMTEAGKGTVGFPEWEDVSRQIVRGHAEAGADDQMKIREALASILENPGDSRFESVLRVAARLPLPEAKPTLLRWLTNPMPGGEPAPGACSPPAQLSTGSGNGHRLAGEPITGRDYRAAVIAALAALRDPQLGPVFETLLSKYGQCGLEQPARLRICREAAVALVTLDPRILGEGLPQELLTDLPFLDRLAGSPEPEVRRAVSTWVNALPQPDRTRVSAGLAALRGRSRRTGSTSV